MACMQDAVHSAANMQRYEKFYNNNANFVPKLHLFSKKSRFPAPKAISQIERDTAPASLS